MTEVKNFFVNNLAQIQILISVIIGGLVTYLATSAAEKRKYKRQVQKETMEQVLEQRNGDRFLFPPLNVKSRELNER